MRTYTHTKRHDDLRGLQPQVLSPQPMHTESTNFLLFGKILEVEKPLRIGGEII